MTMMQATQINYDDLVQEALRGVVKSILTETAVNGLPGDHHFYIAFRTRANGVDLPTHLRERYPDEMTIVIQHKFWGLKVSDEQFEIGLSFNQKPEHLVIPFKAVVGFVDPSVQFALQFHDDAAEADNDAGVPSDVDETTDKAVNAGDNVVTLDAFRKS